LLSEKKIKFGDLLDGLVTSVKDYGAFVKLGDGVQGLMHISQITSERLTSPAKVLAVGAIE
jgi:small subunit ribosomal protein S1